MNKWMRFVALILALVMIVQTLPVIPASAAEHEQDAVISQQSVTVQATPQIAEPEPEPTAPASPEPEIAVQAVRPAADTEDLTWTLADGVLTISGNGDMPNWTNLVGAPWVDRKDEITTVIVEEGITSVGDYAFASCYSLVSVTLPEGVGRIGDYAFYHCSALPGIDLPAGVTALGSRAFLGCSALETIDIPEGVSSIGTYAFDSCSALRQVTLPGSLTEIQSCTFQYCDKLESIVIPEGVTAIGGYAFYFCKTMTNLTLPGSLTTIGNYGFSTCRALKSVEIPEGVTAIGSYAFYDCRAMTDVTLPGTLTTIGSKAFSYCDELASVVIPDSVTDVGSEAFRYCPKLRSVQLSASMSRINSMTFSGCTALETIDIPGSITAIDSEAFRGCESLTAVSIPDSVTTLGNHVFNSCIALQEVQLPGALTSISTGLFASCTALESIEIPETVTTINGYVFSNCSALKSAVLPAGLTSLGSNAFYNCAALEEIRIPDGVTRLQASTFENCSSLRTVTIPEGLTQIDAFVFKNCTALEEIALPGSLTSLGKSAFSGCSALRSVTMPPRLSSFGANMFQNCASLESIVIPEGVTAIGDTTFQNCAALTSVTLPEGLTSIGKYALSGCVSLRELQLPQSLTKLDTGALSGCGFTGIELPDGLTTVGEYAFMDCKNLERIVFPDTVTSLGTHAMENCSALVEAALPDGITELAQCMFWNCTALESVTLPESLTSIGSSSFRNCPALEEITIPESVTEIGANAFENGISLQSVRFPAQLESVGAYAFYGCKALETAELPDGLSTLGTSVFRGCSALGKVDLPDTLTTMGANAFDGCITLREVVIPSGLTVVPDYAFNNCSSLGTVELLGMTTHIGNSAFYGCSSLTYFAISPYVTSIGSYAFYGCDLLEFYGYIDSYGHSYAVENDIPFYDISNPPVTLEVTLTDKSGAAVTEGYEVAWYIRGQTEPVSTGDRLKVTDLTLGYEYEVTLGEELSYRYYQPGRQSVAVDTDGKLTLALEPISTVTFTGQVTDREGAGLAAGITLTQTYNGRYHKTLTFETAPDGSFVLKADNVPTEAVFTRPDGYYAFHKKLLSGRSEEACLDVGTAALYPLPAGDRIDLTILSSASGAEGPAEPVTMTNTSDLAFEVFNKSRGVRLEGAVYQSGGLYLSGSFGAGDILTLTATDRAGRYTAEPVDVVLDADCIAEAELTMVENGSIRIRAISGVEQTRVLVFGADGELLSAETVTSGFASAPLAAGHYRLLLMEQNPYVVSVDDPAMMQQYGLTEGQDYLLLEAEAEKGVITEVAPVTMPTMELSRLCHTDPASTYVSVSHPTASQGILTTVWIRYCLEEDFAARVSDETVLVELPEGVDLVERSVAAFGQTANYTADDNRIAISVGTDQALISFYVVAEKIGTHAITVSLRTGETGMTRTEPLGTGVVTVADGAITAPQYVVGSTVALKGTTAPQSIVRLYEGDVLLGETISNAVGSWRTTCELTNYLGYQVHNIYAVIEKEIFEQPITTPSVSVVYDQEAAALSRVTMYNSVFGSCVFDYENPGPTEIYSVNPAKDDYTFVVRFKGNSSRVSDVMLTVFTTDGGANVYDTVYSENHDGWVAHAKYGNAARMPVNVGVSYAYTSPEGRNYYETEDCEIARIQWDEALKEFGDSQITAGEPVEKGGGYVIPMQIEGFPELSREYTVAEASVGSFEPADLEAQGYFCMNPDTPEEPVYARAVIEGETMILWIVDVTGQSAFTISAPAAFDDAQVQEAAAAILAMPMSSGNTELSLWDFKNLLGIVGEYLDLRILWLVGENREKQVKNFHERIAWLYELLQQTCPNGSSLVQDPAYGWQMVGDLENRQIELYKRIDEQMEDCNRQIVNNLMKDLLLLGSGAILAKLGQYVTKAPWFDPQIVLKTEIWDNLLGTSSTILDGDSGFWGAYNDLFGANPIRIHNEMYRSYDALNDEIQDLYKKLIEDASCEEPEDPADPNERCPDDDKVPLIDPAGYVYEAVESNRLPGVTVTTYYQADESVGPASATEWDAENYDQINPLITDAEGRFAWFVPAGQWAVKYELEGYETAWSEWLPVPPPQMEVNMGLVSTAAPEVESVNVYPDQVRVIFRQYMKADTVRVEVACGGRAVTGTLEAVNGEYDPTGTEQLATVFIFTPDTALSGSAAVEISGAVSYAGKTMLDYAVTMQTAVQPTGIVMEPVSKLVFGETLEIPVQILPAEAGANRTLTVTTSAPGLLDLEAQTLTTDAGGNAVITVIGTLPTTAELTVWLDGTDLETTGTVRVLLRKEEPCQTVTASIPNGSTVAPGTMLELYTATEGAEIYYTLDGTCPCVEDSPSRIYYDGPITLTEDVFLIAYAVKEGFGDSPTAGFIYNVCTHSDTLLENDRQATCTEDGYTGDVICDDCGTVVEQGSVIPAPGHDWDEGVVTVEPTEDHDGEKRYTCRRCGETKTEVLPALNHEHAYDAVVTEPTCTEGGFTTHTCRCGESYVDSYTEALGHNYESVVTEPTCTEPGYTTHTCARCGDSYTDSYTDTQGHDMGQWYTVREMTCTADGLERRECSRCDHAEERTIEAPGHDYESVVTEPTCTKGGYTTHTCLRCGTSYKDRYTNAKGHNYESVVTEPTCTEPGYITHTCLRCGDSYTDSYTNALGHSFGAWTPAGKGMEERKCERCGFTEQRPASGPVNPFTDVPEGSFYYEPVLWAVEKGITNGTTPTTFGPNDQCMRAHVVTFLWRAAGSPEPSSTVNPFVDVKTTDFYYKAVLWAVEKGITNGLDATHFGPFAYCNRAQVVTFLYRSLGSPAVESHSNPFTDMPEGQWFTAPVLWAVENGVTNGLSATQFGPTAICNRAQIVTFLYRAFAK